MSYILEPHVCRHCLGRIASTQIDAGIEFVCTCCGHIVIGDVNQICVCGVKVKDNKSLYRCAANEHKSINNPNEFVAQLVV